MLKVILIFVFNNAEFFHHTTNFFKKVQRLFYQKTLKVN
jgi:hypothetical protein